MKTRLRFRCIHKGESEGWNGQPKVGTVKLSPRMIPEGQPGYEDMKAFYAATPGGQLEFATVNAAVVDSFEIGQDYYITLEPVGAE